MSEYSMTINGESVTSPQTFGVIDPATEAIFAYCPDCTPAQLDSAVEAAARAFPSWQKDEVQRRELLKQCITALQAHTEELAQLETLEQGMPLELAREFVPWALYSLEEAVNMPIPFKIVQDDVAVSAKMVRKPRGVVAAITPWNVPLVVMPFTQVEEVIERANNTHYGLGGSVWTNDLGRGEEIANRLECGCAWVNQHMGGIPNTSYGGRKWSGFGYEDDILGIQEFCDLQVMMNNKKGLE